jgi:hypothetical protein
MGVLLGGFTLFFVYCVAPFLLAKGFLWFMERRRRRRDVRAFPVIQKEEQKSAEKPCLPFWDGETLEE